MSPNWAEENLQTIRTLMERSALYRRALAPVMIFCGAVGITGGVVGWLLKIHSARGFVLWWGGGALVALAGSFLLARQQALKDAEPFWSPPTRRVVAALWPALLAGLLLSLLPIVEGRGYAPSETCVLTAGLWIVFYGCALHSAGFFMPRGIKLFGLVFMLCGCGLFYGLFLNLISDDLVNPQMLMVFFFGGLHLAYGIYLYFTEKKNPVA